MGPEKGSELTERLNGRIKKAKDLSFKILLRGCASTMKLTIRKSLSFSCKGFLDILIFIMGSQQKYFTSLKLILPIIFFILVISAGVMQGAFPSKQDDPFRVYRNSSQDNKGTNFIESASKLGINHSNQVTIKDYSGVIFRLNATVSAVDINNDNFPDLAFSLASNRDVLALYINNNGKSFTSFQSKAFQRKKRSNTNAVLFFDYDLDGRLDILVVNNGCIQILKSVKNDFVDVTDEVHASNICGRFVGANLADFNHDGYPDFILHSNRVYETKSGRYNRIIINKNGKSFEDQTERYIDFYPAYTWGSLLGYFNPDSALKVPDLYLINDFGKSKMYFWQDSIGKYIENKKILPVSSVQGQMGGDVGDLYNQNRNDIYVSNISKVKFNHGFNYLYSLSPDSVYADTAKERGVESCSFGWGARIFDANNDNHEDIIVANGWFNLGKKASWYKYFSFISIPYNLRGDKRTSSRVNNTNLASGQRNCLFLQRENKNFEDITEKSQINDTDDGRSVAIADFNSDGKLDIAIANIIGPPVIYLNDSETRPWIGFKYIRKNNQSNIGTVFILETNKGKMRKEFFPTNGLGGQGEDRIHFGLGDTEPLNLTILSGNATKIISSAKFHKNRYNLIYE